MSEPLDRIGSATRSALKVAALYCALIVAGAVITHGKSLEFFGRSLVVVVACHLGAALFIGIAVGLFRSFASTRLRAAFLGFLITIPLELAVLPIFRPSYGMDIGLPAGILLGLILGAPMGYMLWEPPDLGS